MEEKKISNTTVLAVSAALILVVVLLGAYFLLSGDATGQEEGIVLPSALSGHATEPVKEELLPDAFLRVDTENVVKVLQSLDKPAYYHQIYEVSVGNGSVNPKRTVELWFNGPVIHAQVQENDRIKSVLTDGLQAFLWYDSDTNSLCLPLDEDLTMEDLLGLPGFDYLAAMEQIPVVEADYLVLEEPQTQCIFVCAQENTELAERWWINLENGILYRADALENSQLVYEVRQTQFSLLAQGDEQFGGKFVLPDGSEPFPITRERLLP